MVKRAALGHHKHEKLICSSSTKSERTAAFKRERDHIASSIARLLNGLTTASQLTGEGVAPPRLEIVESGFVDDMIEEATPSLRPRTPQKLEPLVLTSGFETGRVKGSLWDEVEITKQMYRGRIDDVHESLMGTQAKLPKALGAAPPRPHPQRLVERVFAPVRGFGQGEGSVGDGALRTSLCGGLCRKSIIGPRRRGGEPGGDRSSSSRHGGVPIAFRRRWNIVSGRAVASPRHR